MPATRSEARDQILRVVTDAAISAGIKSADIKYTSKASPKPAKDAPVRPWCRVTFRHEAGNKTSLTGDFGRSRFTRNGLLIVQVFAESGDGLVSSDQIIPVIQQAMEGKTTSGGVQFLDVTANEIGEDGVWFNTNINARIEYDEFVNT